MKRFIWTLLGLAAILALPRAGAAQGITSIRVASGLSGPVFATSPPGDTQRLFIVEFNTARIKILKNGSVLSTPFLDIGSLVTDVTNFGLLGLTFHPNYASNGFFYVQYVDNSFHPTVARYHVSANPDVADASSAQIVIQLSDFSIVDHQGGTVAFGPNDGYLYAAFGDGQACDPGNRAQNDGDLHGKMLRLDVDSDAFPADPNRNYAIPSTNPYVGGGNPLDEIWSKGFRNPFRFTFDRANGDLYIGNVGQAQREEVEFAAAGSNGQNYGWRLKEGTVCFNATSGCTPNTVCPCPGCTDPIYEYDHSAGNCSISGGSVYRGSAIPSLQGTYFFGDWCTARIWSFKYNGSSVTDFTDRTTELTPQGGFTINQPVAIGEDAAGELYIVDMGGEIFQIVPTAPSSIPALGGPGIAVFVLLLAAGAVAARRSFRPHAAAR